MRNLPATSIGRKTTLSPWVIPDFDPRLDAQPRAPYGLGLVMERHKGFIASTIVLVIAGVVTWYFTQTWDGWEYILQIVGKGDNMPIAGLIPIITFFTYLALDEAFRHDRLIKQGRQEEILDEMYK
jgi:hypothetical protein